MGTPYQSTHIVHITDTTDRNAELKVRSAYALHKGRTGLRNADVDFAPAGNTLDIGVVASELVNNSQRPHRLILSVNCAPPDNKDGTKDNARNDFFCADLGNNTFVCGTSNGFEFSYIKNEIKEFYRLTTTNSKKSQFRSLEILPEHALLFADPKLRKALIANNTFERVANLDDIIPSPPDQTHVFEVDNFHNVKLFPSARDLDLLRQHEGKDIRFRFGKASLEIGKPIAESAEEYRALVAPTLFAAPLNSNVLALRSSSRLAGEENHVPIIATIRERPAETKPLYTRPEVGAPVWLTLAAG